MNDDYTELADVVRRFVDAQHTDTTDSDVPT